MHGGQVTGGSWPADRGRLLTAHLSGCGAGVPQAEPLAALPSLQAVRSKQQRPSGGDALRVAVRKDALREHEELPPRPFVVGVVMGTSDQINE
eukprot:s20_g27.t1